MSHFSAPCKECQFELWLPVFSNDLLQVGLYDDARFPGRLIVMLNEHYDFLEDLPDALTAKFFWELQSIMRTLKAALGVDRVNMAVLGNSVSHVHAHLIPRRPTDPSPNESPWSDPRPKTVLEAPALEELLRRLRLAYHA